MSSVVYFIHSVEGPVKIGWSEDLGRRQRNLATAGGLGVVLASIAGGPTLEAHFHEMLAEHRMSGEWFRPHPAVLALAESIRVGQYVPPAGYKDNIGKKPRFVVSDAAEAARNEARDLVQRIAGNRELGTFGKHLFRRVAAKTGLTGPRIKRIWYREARVIHSAEMDRLRDVAFEIEAQAPPIVALEARLAALEDMVAAAPASSIQSAAHR